MKKVNRRKMQDTSSHNVWRSYSDMMSGLLLLFVLIMAVCLMQAQKNYTEKLAEQAKQLQTQNALDLSQTQLDEQASQLASQQTTLDEQAAALIALQSTLDEQAKQLSQKEKDLAASQTQLERIDQIIGVKADLIASLNEEFKTNQINVDIDYQTGAIVLDSSVLFELNESELTQEGQAILAQILPVYCKVLLSEEYEPYLAEVIVDGYTDTQGDYITNLSLSQRRAYAVAEYLVYSEDSFLTAQESSILREKLTANGRSMSNPILDANGQVDMDASRRVEIKFRLKDEEMMSELQRTGKERKQ